MPKTVSACTCDLDLRARMTPGPQEVLTSSSFCISMRKPVTLPVMATADAMATADMAGFGGVAFFNDSLVQIPHQFG